MTFSTSAGFRRAALFALALTWCTGAPTARAWDITVVDDTVGVGAQSAALLSWGQTAVAYYDNNASELRYAWYDLETWHTTTVRKSDAGLTCDLIIRHWGAPEILAAGASDGLHYFFLEDNTWHDSILDDDMTNLPLDGSLTWLPDGGLAAAYSVWDGAQHTHYLRYSVALNRDWFPSVIAQNLDDPILTEPSLATLNTGHPAVAYCAYLEDAGEFRYAAYNGSAWSSETIDTANGGRYISLAILPSGRPVVAYDKYATAGDSTPQLWFAEYDGTAWRTTKLDEKSYKPSLVIHPDTGQPLIAYGWNELKYAAFDGSAWATETVDSDAWFSPSLIVWPPGVTIAYRGAEGGLKVATRGGTTGDGDTGGDDTGGGDTDGDTTPTDRDGDGTPDDQDQCPDDPAKVLTGTCGCGTPDTDTDGDGIFDCFDSTTNTPSLTPGAVASAGGGCGLTSALLLTVAVSGLCVTYRRRLR